MRHILNTEEIPPCLASEHICLFPIIQNSPKRQFHPIHYQCENILTGKLNVRLRILREKKRMGENPFLKKTKNQI